MHPHMHELDSINVCIYTISRAHPNIDARNDVRIYANSRMNMLIVI